MNNKFDLPDEGQLFATIRKESKYFEYQQPLDCEGKPIPFPVKFTPNSNWCIIGGLGGRYMLFDVQLYMFTGARFKILSMHENPLLTEV